VHRSTIASNGAVLGTCLLATLILGPLPAQESSGPYSSDERTECGADLAIADASVVIEELSEPIYVHSLSKSEISSLENESSGHLREAVGLTLVLAGAVQTHMGEAQTESGASCAVVESVRILPMKEVTVYVAREYAVGSCNYDAVRRHEDEHVAIARRLVSEYRPRLLRAVTGLRLQSPGFATQVEENASTRIIASDVLSAVQGVIDELQRAMRDANRLLDQRDTGKTLRKCSAW
jgi:hypothetical protein